MPRESQHDVLPNCMKTVCSQGRFIAIEIKGFAVVICAYAPCNDGSDARRAEKHAFHGLLGRFVAS